MFILSLIAVTIVASLTDHTLSVLLATAFGFLLSQDIFLNTKALLSFVTLPCKIGSSLRNQLFNKTYISYSAIDFHSVDNYKSYLIHLLVSAFKGAFFLAVSLTIVYFVFTLSSAEELVTSIIAGCVIGLYVLLQFSDTLQSVYIFKIFRNPLFPKQCENAEKFKKGRNRLRYLSIPRRLIVTYCESNLVKIINVLEPLNNRFILIIFLLSFSLSLSFPVSPLLLLAYVGIALDTTTTSIPHIWYGIAAARILRKVNSVIYYFIPRLL